MSSSRIQVSQDAKILGNQSEDFLSPLYVVTETLPIVMFTIEPRMMSIT